MCKLFAHPGGLRFSGFRGEDLRRGWGIQGGLIHPSELCVGTSEFECSASWSYYIIYTFLILL